MAKAMVTKRRKKASHARGTVNKAQAIRDAAKKLGKKVRPRDVIAALAAEGITVSSPQVSTTLKAAGYRKSRRRGRSAGAKSTAKPHANGSAMEVSLDHLLAAKALATKLGGVKAAQIAIAALARLS